MGLRCLIFFLTLMMTLGVSAETERLTLDFKEVNIRDVLRILLTTQALNSIISPLVQGNVSLHMEKVTAKEALNTLLLSRHLFQWQIQDTWYVGSSDEYLKYRENENKLKRIADEMDPIVTRIWQIQYAKAEALAHLIENNKNSFLSKRGSLSFDLRTNRLCVRDTKVYLENIYQLILRLDIPVRQVLIEAHLASIDRDYERELGVHFDVRQTIENDGSISSGGYNVAMIKLPNGTSLDMQLAAMERMGHGKLISSPSLFTESLQTAVIESGEEIPYQESSSSGATSVTFKKAVLSLKVTPQIMPDRHVLLALQVNQDKPSKRMVLGVPAINTRQMTTNINVKTGQTIVLGGIYEESEEQEERRIPFLANIPGLGWLFKQQNNLLRKRELLIFVTPRIIS